MSQDIFSDTGTAIEEVTNLKNEIVNLLREILTDYNENK